jgi:hypothetical protein
MGLADRIRIMLGNLTPGEIEERDAAARKRQEDAEREAAAERAAQNAAAQRAAAARTAQREQTDLYQDRLLKAGGVANLELVCHEDTWSFIKGWFFYDHRRYSWWPDRYNDRVAKRGDKILSVRLSGLQAAQVVSRMGWAAAVPGVDRPYATPPASDTERAVAQRIYDAIGAVLDQVDPDAGNDREVPPAVLDDRPGSPLKPLDET